MKEELEQKHLEDYVIDKYKEAREDLLETLNLTDYPINFCEDYYFMAEDLGLCFSKNKEDVIDGDGDSYMFERIFDKKTYGSYTFILATDRLSKDVEFYVFKTENEVKED